MSRSEKSHGRSDGHPLTTEVLSQIIKILDCAETEDGDTAAHLLGFLYAYIHDSIVALKKDACQCRDGDNSSCEAFTDDLADGVRIYGRHHHTPMLIQIANSAAITLAITQCLQPGERADGTTLPMMTAGNLMYQASNLYAAIAPVCDDHSERVRISRRKAAEEFMELRTDTQKLLGALTDEKIDAIIPKV
jgi:hypothetical protein